MQHKIICKLKSEEGSSLAFVIIIGLVILMLVASIMAIANSDFTFTQQSLESRQAYIDAKSVIEYGKIEINDRISWLKTENTNLNDLYTTRQAILSQKNPDTTAIDSQIRAKISEIDTHMKTNYYIDGDADAVATSLKKRSSETDKSLGVFSVTSDKTPAFGENFNSVVFTFDIKTEKLRRKLDYRVGISLDMLNGGTDPIKEPDKPVISDDDFLQTKIQAKRNLIQCIIQKKGNQEDSYDDDSNTLTVNTPSLNLDIGMHNNQFSWIGSRILDMTAKNIIVTAPVPTQNIYDATLKMTAESSDGSYGTIQFKSDYVQANGNNRTNTLCAKNVVFDGDLTIKDNTMLDICCENLYVTGNIIINSPNGTRANFLVHGLTGDGSKAKNIYVGGTISVGNKSKLSWNSENIWVKGDISTRSTHATLEFKGFNYLETANISLNDRAQLLATGINPDLSQMKTKSITPATSNYCSLNIAIEGVWSFICDDLAINGNSNLSLTANVVKINKNFTLSEQVSEFKVKTQYFDCTGMTNISNMKSDLYILRISDLKPLNVRFEGGFKVSDTLGQQKSFIIGEVNNPATMVVLGKATDNNVDGLIALSGGNGAGLNIFAKDIYFDSNHIDLQDNARFYYSGGQSGQTTNFHIRSNVAFGNVAPGSYLGVTGKYPDGLINPTGYTTYTPPNFASIPTAPGGSGSGSGSGTGTGTGSGSGTGNDRIQEKYY